MLTVFQDYEAISINIVDIINASGYKNDYIARKIGLTPHNFSMKKQRKRFTAKELQHIVEIITEPNEDAEDAIMLEIMRSRENEPTIPVGEFEKRMGWK